ncbi:hypothetical protein ASC90_11705 [Rhizobium sp. Root1220]|nr:hypothetical protein ASC90_11705 [Rhizobium sp. Root1220]
MSFPILFFAARTIAQTGAFGRYDMQVFMVGKREGSDFNDHEKHKQIGAIRPDLVVPDAETIQLRSAAR